MKIFVLLCLILMAQFSAGADLEVRVYSSSVRLAEGDSAISNSGVVGVYSRTQFERFMGEAANVELKGATADFVLKETRLIHDVTASWLYRIVPESEGLKGKYSGVAFSFERVARGASLRILKAAYFTPVEMNTSLEVKLGDFVLFQHVDLAKGECLFYAVCLKGDFVE